MTTDTYWWASPAVNMDCYQVFVVRYTTDDNGVKSECLDNDGRWLEYPEGGAITCALTIPGVVVHLLGGAESLRLHREDFTGQVEAALAAIAVGRKR